MTFAPPPVTCTDIGQTAPERDVRWYPSRALLLGHPEQIGGARPVYLPAVAPYFIAVPELREVKSWGTESAFKSAQVTLPEGVRGARSKLPTTVYAARSPRAVASCDAVEDGRHEWNRAIGGRIWCNKCGCEGGIEPLSLVEAPRLTPVCQHTGATFSRPQWAGSWSGGGVGCDLGDDETRRKWAEICSARTDAIRRFGVPDDVRERQALLQRASDDRLDAGGRWLLPDRFAPEGCRAEGERWVDLGELLVTIAVAHMEAGDEGADLWRKWIAGDPSEGEHRHQPPRDVFEDALRLALEEIGRMLGDGRPVYVDARAVVDAIARTRQRWSAHVPVEPCAPPRELREMHDALNRRTRGSLLLLLPPKPTDGRDPLAGIRQLWASGR
jgi:hypothetical protein